MSYHQLHHLNSTLWLQLHNISTRNIKQSPFTQQQNWVMSSPARNVESSKISFQPGKERSGSRSGSQHGPSPFKRPTFQDEQRISQSTKNPLINKETRNIFYKTRLCKKKMQGNCPKGEEMYLCSWPGRAAWSTVQLGRIGAC